MTFLFFLRSEHEIYMLQRLRLWSLFFYVYVKEKLREVVHKIDLPKKLAICLSSIQSESLVRDLEMEEGRITIIKNMW